MLLWKPKLEEITQCQQLGIRLSLKTLRVGYPIEHPNIPKFSVFSSNQTQRVRLADVSRLNNSYVSIYRTLNKELKSLFQETLLITTNISSRELAAKLNFIAQTLVSMGVTVTATRRAIYQYTIFKMPYSRVIDIVSLIRTLIPSADLNVSYDLDSIQVSIKLQNKKTNKQKVLHFDRALFSTAVTWVVYKGETYAS